MKNKLWLLFLAVGLVVVTACSDDKNDKSMAEKVAGTYVGTISVTQEDGTAVGAPLKDQKIYIVATGEYIVTLELKDFKFGQVPVGDLKVTGVVVTEEGKVIGTANQVPIMGGIIKADLKVSGTLKDDKADLLIVVNAPLSEGGTPIIMNVTFKGKK